MSETREAYLTKDTYADAESIRQKLTELTPLVSWRVEAVADSWMGRFEIIGSVVISGEVVNIGYSLSTEQYYYSIQKRDGSWQALSRLLVSRLVDGILAWRPNESA